MVHLRSSSLTVLWAPARVQRDSADISSSGTTGDETSSIACARIRRTSFISFAALVGHTREGGQDEDEVEKKKKVVGSGVLCESFSAIIETEGPHSVTI